MSNRYAISDTHFGHTNSWAKFKLEDGVTPLRPFTSTEEMDQTMIDRWNKRIKPQDVVYHLGDVAINKNSLECIRRLNGKKRLIRGNHDIFDDKLYYEAGFEQIHGVRVFTDKFVMSHIPIHPDCISNRYVANVHGHLHANRVKIRREAGDIIDPRYVSACVEVNDFTPISFDELEAIISNQRNNC